MKFLFQAQPVSSPRMRTSGLRMENILPWDTGDIMAQPHPCRIHYWLNIPGGIVCRVCPQCFWSRRSGKWADYCIDYCQHIPAESRKAKGEEACGAAAADKRLLLPHEYWEWWHDKSAQRDCLSPAGRPVQIANASARK